MCIINPDDIVYADAGELYLEKERGIIMTVKEALEKRYSVRGFKETKLSAEEINEILLAGLHSPTGCNKQEIHFSVIDGDNPILKELEEEKNRLRNITNATKIFYYDAPVLFVLSGESDFQWSHIDAGIAVQSMALRAEEMGLGSLILGCVYDAMHGEKQEYFEKALGIPDNFEFEIALAVGHKDATKEPHTFDKDSQVTIIDN